MIKMFCFMFCSRKFKSLLHRCIARKNKMSVVAFQKSEHGSEAGTKWRFNIPCRLAAAQTEPSRRVITDYLLPCYKTLFQVCRMI